MQTVEWGGSRTEFEPLLYMVKAPRLLGINPQDVMNQPGLGVMPGIQTAIIWRVLAFMLNCWLRLSARSLRFEGEIKGPFGK